ncbi:MAG TPA: hypothetical protein VFJ74_13990 [Gemmatimonadaceae bacterium]|nr:hypothetical protein [Gemmatimonadaceae bacterium]
MTDRDRSCRRWTKAAGAPERRLVDAVGRTWRVYEMALDYDRRRGAALVFECDAVVRRLRSFPDDWHQLPVAELQSLAEIA